MYIRSEWRTPMTVIVLSPAADDATQGRLWWLATARARAASLLAINPITALIDWLKRGRERDALLGLSDHCLKDLGLSRDDIEHEARRLSTLTLW
jgi:uncharacterized protein YjiS (DUF1127 family)